MDTAPNNENGVDRELRDAQIELRLCELEEAYRVLKMICAGNGDEVSRQNLRGPGYVGGTSRGLDGVDWTLWKNRFHVDKMTMAGHSFGAATIVEVLRHTERFKNVQAGIIYDIWGSARHIGIKQFPVNKRQSAYQAASRRSKTPDTPPGPRYQL